jgi:hypothetical protein
MIIIEKSLSANTIYATCTEINTGVTSGVSINIFNRFTNVSTTISGLTDTSLYPERINEYTLSASSYSGLSTGKYSFTITNIDDIVVEEGMLQVTELIQTQEQRVADTWAWIPPTSTDDDYIVNPN